VAAKALGEIRARYES